MQSQWTKWWFAFIALVENKMYMVRHWDGSYSGLVGSLLAYKDISPRPGI